VDAVAHYGAARQRFILEIRAGLPRYSAQATGFPADILPALTGPLPILTWRCSS
jgi:hypothetical protein